ncbi:hypothetical protein DDE82_006947 [Stemphylium lycopersici]|nr:hypothetical protein DDE82_006947 [Stemphylium lycopersici]
MNQWWQPQMQHQLVFGSSKNGPRQHSSLSGQKTATKPFEGIHDDDYDRDERPPIYLLSKQKPAWSDGGRNEPPLGRMEEHRLSALQRTSSLSRIGTECLRQYEKIVVDKEHITEIHDVMAQQTFQIQHYVVA